MINEECKKKTINEHTKYKQKKKKKKLNLEEQLLWREKYLENVCVYKREREREKIDQNTIKQTNQITTK